MPIGFLADAERERLRRFPGTVSDSDTAGYFTLSSADLDVVRRRTGDHNRLGFALLLCTIRYLGFAPVDLSAVPSPVVGYVARQLRVPPQMLMSYGARDRTRHLQIRAVLEHLGMRRPTANDWSELSGWLLDRALEHDKPTLLLGLVCERLFAAKILRPGVTILERVVSHARDRAQLETYERLKSLLPDERRAMLDGLLRHDEEIGRTPLVWLRRGATRNNGGSILNAIAKREYLAGQGFTELNLDAIPPNRIKFLAQIGRKSTSQAIERMSPVRRYPVLLAFAVQTGVDVLDEIVDLYDRCLAHSYGEAGREMDLIRKRVARSTNEKVVLLQEVGSILLDPSIADDEVRPRVFDLVAPDSLEEVVHDCARIARPLDDHYFDLLATKYSYFRTFAPAFLDALDFRSAQSAASLLDAAMVLRTLNATGRRSVPVDAPMGFITAKWWPYLYDGKGRIVRRFYELCVLWELRAAIRAGDVWLEGSRRHADPSSYLIASSQWRELRLEACTMLHLPLDGRERLAARREELEGLLGRLDREFPKGGFDIEDGSLHIPRLRAVDAPPEIAALEQMVSERLPQIDLSELLIEVDGWTNFTECFEHAGGSEPRTRDLRTYLFAAVISQACNFGPVMMAKAADLALGRLGWCTTWYLREETLRAAMVTVVNHQHRLPLARIWGGGTLSSSDGQRFPVSVRSRHATAIPRYFGYGRGVTFYTWTSDQFSQYGTKVIPSTTRDALYVLDEILDNETELDILEHTTDTAGYTEIVFALFDLLGLVFSPRIRDLGDQHLYRMSRDVRYLHLEPLLKGTIRKDLILESWDELLRVAGSLKLGWVTASLLVGKLQSKPRQSTLSKVLQEYGRLVKTIFILRYADSEDFRRRIGTQINKGEALHALRNYLFFANEGKVRRRHQEEQANQASCLNLVVNAIVTWNTVYMHEVIAKLRREGIAIADADVAHLSPARYGHINPYGKYRFDVEAAPDPATLRPLRDPEEG